MQFLVTTQNRTPMIHMMKVFDEKYEGAAKKYALTFGKRSRYSRRPVVYVAKMGKEIQRMSKQETADWLGTVVYDGEHVLARPTPK
jgi:hypothetical protein